MEAMLQEKLAIDKTSWNPVKFGDVVFEPKESTNNPVEDGIEHVVGLEHIDTENIHLNKSASIEESTTFSKRFAVGDVLFGRRRAYLKKGAQASFNGICSGDITVFRAKENLMPELLPFIVNNEKFFDYAVKHSAGGLSPRVKFKDLAKYKFLLPPKDQQAQLAKLLWTLDEVIEREKEVLRITKLIKSIKLKGYFKIRKNSKVKRINNLCKVSSGGTAPQGEKYFIGGTMPFIRMQHLNNLEEDKYPTRFDLINNHGISHKRLKLIDKGSILLAKSGESIRSEKKAILNKDSYVVNHLAILNEFEEGINYEYLFYFFQYFKLSSLISQTTTPSVSLGDLGRIKVPFVDLSSQRKIVKLFRTFDNILKESKDRISSSKCLQKSIINQIF